MHFFYSILALSYAIAPSIAQGPPGGGGGGPPSNQANSPAYTLYSKPLFIAPIAKPDYVQTTNGRTIQFFTTTVQPFQQQIYPNLGKANLIGYNGTSPGPTYMIQRGTETVIRTLNNGSRASAMHLHGSYTHAAWDGWAADEIPVGSYKDYYYPNTESARPIWYHDHAQSITSTNNYYGQSGVYIIHDPAEASLGLPSGKYDVPLAIVDKAYTSNGDLANPRSSPLNFFGDVIQVNGVPWPFFNVEPRKYRFRFYDMSLSRPYNLIFVDSKGNNIPFQVIGSDSGLFGKPVSASSVTISMGERYEVVFDFAPYAGQNVLLNNAGFSNLGFITNYANTDKVMKFTVGNKVSSTANNGAVPSTLNSKIAFPQKRTTVDHTFNFQLGQGDATWTINGIDFEDTANRVLARPPQGAVELWKVVHTGGPAVHPVHVHLVNFQVISRSGGSGRGVLPYESAGLKDIVLLEPGETVEILAQYAPWNGLYMFHCHNLIHEDQSMLDVFNVTLLSNLGYNFSSTTQFADPTDSRFSAQKYNAAAYSPAAVSAAVSSLGALNAYAPASSLLAAESTYWAAHTFTSEGQPEATAAAKASVAKSDSNKGKKKKLGPRAAMAQATPVAVPVAEEVKRDARPSREELAWKA